MKKLIFFFSILFSLPAFSAIEYTYSGMFDDMNKAKAALGSSGVGCKYSYDNSIGGGGGKLPAQPANFIAMCWKSDGLTYQNVVLVVSACVQPEVSNPDTSKCEAPDSPTPPGTPPEGAVGPDENGNCADAQTLTDGWCYPDAPKPENGQEIPVDVHCGTGEGPVCDFGDGQTIASNCGGWACESFVDDYIPIADGGGCRQYESGAWYCSYIGRPSLKAPDPSVGGSYTPYPVAPGSNVSTSPSVPPVSNSHDVSQTYTDENNNQVTVTNTEHQQEVYVYDPQKNNYQIRTTNTQTGEYSTQSGSGPGPGPGSTLGTGGGTGSGPGTSQGGYSQCHDTFSCSGDAVQCGIAKSLFDMRCAHNIPEDVFDANNIYGSISPSDAEKALNKDGLFDFDILAAFNDKRKAYLAFSSGCMGSVSIPVFGTQVVADLTVLCELGTVIKFLFHIAAYLLCIRIIHATLV